MDQRSRVHSIHDLVNTTSNIELDFVDYYNYNKTQKSPDLYKLSNSNFISTQEMNNNNNRNIHNPSPMFSDTMERTTIEHVNNHTTSFNSSPTLDLRTSYTPNISQSSSFSSIPSYHTTTTTTTTSTNQNNHTNNGIKLSSPYMRRKLDEWRPKVNEKWFVDAMNNIPDSEIDYFQTKIIESGLYANGNQHMMPDNTNMRFMRTISRIGGTVCHNCLKTEIQVKREKHEQNIKNGMCNIPISTESIFEMCTKCNLVYYCSRDCQANDWSATHCTSHKNWCAKPRTAPLDKIDFLPTIIHHNGMFR